MNHFFSEPADIYEIDFSPDDIDKPADTGIVSDANN